MHLTPAPTCTRCPALVASRNRIVPGYGNAAAGIVFVGEAPGQRGADRTGVPFSGDKSGARLQAILRTLGLAEADSPLDAPHLRCFVTNAVRCCPPANRTPTPREITNCASWLHAELDAAAPQIIVPIGRVALQAIGLRYLHYNPGPIRPLHASVLFAGMVTIVPCVHPSRISHAQVTAFVAVMHRLLERATIASQKLPNKV